MDDMRQASLTYAHGPPTSTLTTSLSQPRCAHVSAHTKTLVNQFSADLMSRNCVHKRLPNRSPFAFRNTCTMLLQIPTSIRSCNTLPTPCTLLLGKKVGYRRQQKSTWFDDECRQVAIEKNDAYQAIEVSCNSSCLRKVPREKRRLFRRQKHEFVKGN